MDAVFNFGIIHHLENWEQGIREICSTAQSTERPCRRRVSGCYPGTKKHGLLFWE
jgi:hypothetical protein